MGVIDVRGVGKRFGPTVALDGVDFSVLAGEVHALVGENGSGKSTLMRILHGEVRPDSGSMTLAGESYAPSGPREAMDRGVTLIHQELAVSDHLRVWENVFLGAEVARGGWLGASEMRARARDCLERLGRGDIDVDVLAGRLSPGQKQVVEIARALRSKAKVVLFDEPTSSLGHQDVEALFGIVRWLRAEGIGVVYISHFLDEIKEVCDRATVLRDGEVVGTVTVAERSTRELAGMMAGRSVEEVYPRSVRVLGDIVLDVRELSGRRSPRGVSFVLRRGEVLGVAGLNGAGRTETLRCLFGLDRGTGSVTWSGVEGIRSPSGHWRSGTGFVSEDRKGEGLALNLSLAENLALPGLGGWRFSRGEVRQRTTSVMERLGVKARDPDQAIGALSGGNQQKIAIGRLLDADSSVLLLDEPTRGIDVRAKGEIYEIIDQLASAGKAVVLVSSHLPELLGLCDRILVLRRGELVGEVSAKETSERELMEMCAGA